jgi:hypothetical protein
MRFMPAIHRISLVWLFLTFSSPEQNHNPDCKAAIWTPAVILGGTAKLLGILKCAFRSCSNSWIPNQRIPRCLTKYTARQGGRLAERTSMARHVASHRSLKNNRYSLLLHQMLLSTSCCCQPTAAPQPAAQVTSAAGTDGNAIGFPPLASRPVRAALLSIQAERIILAAADSFLRVYLRIAYRGRHSRRRCMHSSAALQKLASAWCHCV